MFYLQEKENFKLLKKDLAGRCTSSEVPKQPSRNDRISQSSQDPFKR